ncbi:MAG: AAA family ATPase, partial [Leptospiraceae bacterium]|nr:AAA family ATPase [Leptospiraceae bacterium]
MKIKSLTLKNFRNHKDLSLLFNKRLIFFIGENGEGKTNILESLNMFATLKSFRNNSDEEISGWEDNYYFLQTEVEKNLNSFRAEIGFSKKIDKKKKVKLNGEELKKKSEFIGEVKCVVFSPVDLQILDGGPSERRKFID